jgi:hypothetical protein
MFNNDFIFEAQSFKDFTEDYFAKERKKLKIKEIKIVVHGSESFDSIYLNSNTDFKKKLKDVNPLDHSFYSYIKIYKYNNLGELISYEEYPICNYLTSEDSLQFSKRIIKTLEIGNQTIISKMNKDTIYEQLTYKNELLISKFYRNELSISKYDTSSKTWISKLTRTNEIFKYTYLDNNNLDKIYLNNRLILEYKYPNKNSITIKNHQFDDDSTHDQTMENVVTKNTKNKIISSVFYQPKYPDYRHEYVLKYDKNAYLIKIIEKELQIKKYENSYTNTEYKNSYDNLKHRKTIVHCNFNAVNNDIVYTYDEKGFVKTISQGGKTEYFEYTFFDK